MTTVLNGILAMSAAFGPVDGASVPSSADKSTPPAHQCYEGFDYSPPRGTLVGRSGGEGFEGPWIPAGFNARNPEAYGIVAGSLGSSAPPPGKAYVKTEASSSVAMSLDFGYVPPNMTYQPIKGIGRRLASPISSHETTTLYVAALFRPERAAGPRPFGGYIGFYLDGTDNSDLFIGVGGGNLPKYGLENRGGDRLVISDHFAEAGRTDLLVVKAEFKPGLDIFTLFINPDTRAPEPLVGTVKGDLDLGAVDQVVLYSTGAFSIDDLRMVDTYAALSDYPNPEELRRIAPIAQDATRKQVRDDFDKQFTLNWQIANVDLARISLAKNPGALTITTQAGEFYGAASTYKNLILTANPVEGTGDFEVTTCVIGFDPRADYQQAGLVCLDDEDNFIKWTYEWNEARGCQVLALIRETSGNPAPHTYVLDIPQGEKLWMRLSKQGNQYTYSASQDGDSFRVYGTLPWGDVAPSWMGLVACNATDTAPEIDGVFDFFEVHSQPGTAPPPG